MNSLGDYKEFQPGNLIFAIVIPVHIFLIISYIYQLGNNPIPLSGFLSLNVTFALVYLFFFGMKTLVTSEKIVVSFGIGLIRRTVMLNNIESVTRVNNAWYYGWGIHFIPNGILYNIGGLEGVEISLNNSGRVIRIGSKTPGQLRDEIQKRLPK